MKHGQNRFFLNLNHSGVSTVASTKGFKPTKACSCGGFLQVLWFPQFMHLKVAHDSKLALTVNVHMHGFLPVKELFKALNLFLKINRMQYFEFHSELC